MTEPDPFSLADDAARRWSLTDVRQVADTPTSRVYRALRGTGGPAVALKVLKPYGADEMTGARLLAWYAGDGAAAILDRRGSAMLLEWLDGPPLGDTVRAGGDEEATAILTDVLARLHRPRPNPPHGLRPLRRQFSALLDETNDFWPASHLEHAARAAAIATALFEDDVPPVPLHGDFHHDNVMKSARGWLAIDPKGLVGDPAFDLANVFRNPLGALDLALRPERIDRLATTFARELRYDPRRMLGWAASLAAVSACWNSAVGNPIDDDLRLLETFLDAVDRT